MIVNNNIVNNIYKLPDDIINIIKDYLQNTTLVFVNKINYNSYHYLIKKHIHNYESFIRDMIRKDYYFFFNKVIRENFDNWLNIRQYRYKTMIYNSYIYFVFFYCIEQQADACKNILLELFEERNFGKNLHKKKVIKYIKWKN